MSTRLRGDTAYELCRVRLRQVPYLVHPDLEPEFMCSLAIKYTTAVFSRLERVACTNLFAVERGVVAKKGCLGLAGSCFGLDVILSNTNLRDLGDGIALTFVQIISLTQNDIFSLLPEYPRANFVLRKAALRMALVRALVKASQHVKRLRNSGSEPSISRVFDAAMDEAAQARIEEDQRNSPERMEHVSLTLKKVDFEELAKIKVLKQLRNKYNPQGGNTKWSRLSRQKTNFKKAETTNQSKASAIKAKLSAAAKAAPKNLNFMDKGNLLKEADTRSTESRLDALADDVKLVKGTASQLIEMHTTLVKRLDSIQEINANLLTVLKTGVANRDAVLPRRRNPVRQGSSAKQIINGNGGHPAASPQHATRREEREELRNEGALPAMPSSPFMA